MNSIKKIKNGSLYINKDSARVERVIGRINSQRVWTTHHDDTPRAVRIYHLDIAPKEKIKNYLDESPNMQNA